MVLVTKGPDSCTIENSVKNRWTEAGVGGYKLTLGENSYLQRVLFVSEVKIGILIDLTSSANTLLHSMFNIFFFFLLVKNRPYHQGKICIYS